MQVILLVGRAGIVTWGGYDLAEGIVLQRVLGDQIHVISGRIMVFIKQTVRIDKVGVQTADFLCLFIHHIRKCFQRAAADFVCQHNRSLICRWKHDCIEQLFYGKCFSQNDAAGRNTAAVGNVDFINIVLQFSGEGQLLTQVGEMLEGEDGGHNLGQ